MSNSAGVGTNMNVSGERPQFDLPMGNVPDLVARYYFRSDTPTGRSIQQPPPEAVTMFRQLIQSGAIVPKNQAAQNMAMSEGGIQNGQASMFGPDVPFIEGLPGGMDAATWNALTARAEQKFQERVKAAELSGQWEGKSTLERERIEAEIKRDIFKNETDRYTAEQNVRQKDIDLSRLEQERVDARRAGDLDREQALNIEIDRQKRLREEMTGWVGGEGGQGGPGGTATLSREQQAFEQATKAAELAANPRTGIQSWMMGQRGGLNGQPAVNFVPPSTTVPGGPQITPTNAYEMPGGTTTAAGQLGPQAAGQTFQPPNGQPEPMMYAGGSPTFNENTGQNMTMEQMAQFRQQAMLEKQRALAGQQPGQMPMMGGPEVYQPGGLPPAQFQAPTGQAQQDGQVQAQSAFQAAQQATGQKAGPTATPTGQNQLPTTAFTESLMQGKAVPNQGNTQTQGAWWNAANFQQQANPGKWRVQDFMRGTRDEQQGALGAASFAGFSDETTQDLLKKQLPTFSAPRSGRLA